MISDDRTGKMPESEYDKAKRLADHSFNQQKGPEKYWSYDSVKAEITVEKLYDYLFKKGYRYFHDVSDNYNYIVIVKNNTVDALFLKVWKLCCNLLDKDFSTVSEDEKSKVKDALKELRKTLKKRQLIQLMPEELKSFKDTGGKLFLKVLSIKSKNMGDQDYE